MMQTSEKSSYFQSGHIVYVGEWTQMPVVLTGGLSMPCALLQQTVAARCKTLETQQCNNHLVALSVLKSAVCSFLRFKDAFSTLLSKGDDNTQLSILMRAIEELRSANQSYDVLIAKDDPLRLFIVEPSFVSDVRELFEHCIKVLCLTLHLLGGRDKLQIHMYEYLSQTYGWLGWQQTSEQIMLSNNALRTLGRNMATCNKDNTHYRAVVCEVECFSACVDYVCQCFMQQQYPTETEIVAIYKRQDIDITSYFHKRVKSPQTFDSATGLPKKSWFG
jgi:hypothetical protein